MPYCTLPDNTNLYYEIYGAELDLSGTNTKTRPTIVVCHGGPNADHTFHVPFFKRLENEAQIILYDHRGCGRSEGDSSEQWNLKQWASDLHDFCCALKLQSPYIAGISFGGWVVMQYSVLYPNDNNSGFILLDTEGFFDLEKKIEDYQLISNKPEIKEVVYNYYKHPSEENMERFGAECVPLFTNRPFPTSLMQHCISKDNMDEHFKLNVVPHYNLLNKLSIVTTPVLYINGTTNPHHSKKSAQQTAEALVSTKVELKLLENIGFSTVDNPGLVADLIKCSLKNSSSE